VFTEGDRVLVWDDSSAVAISRKLWTHWLGPYVFEKKLSSVSYMLRAESDHRIALVHVNRMRRWSSQAAEETRDPKVRFWSDSRRVVQSILERREREGKVGKNTGYRRSGDAGPHGCLGLASQRWQFVPTSFWRRKGLSLAEEDVT
jgi:hypothetical protein